jgi:hypothetical protein
MENLRTPGLPVEIRKRSIIPTLFDSEMSVTLVWLIIKTLLRTSSIVSLERRNTPYKTYSVRL